MNYFQKFIKEGLKRTLIIAEISANHCGSKKKFLEHIIQANECGADMVKIQTYEPQDMVVEKKFKLRKGLWKGENLWSLYKKACTPFDWHKDAFNLAKRKKISLFSTPFSLRSLKFLKEFKPKFYKVASFELTDHKLINEISKLNVPIILSTGLASMNEIHAALKVIRKHHNKIILLYCVSGYPTKLEDVNFKNLTNLRKKTKVRNIGFSDHTLGVSASLDAIDNKAFLIEKHFTLKKNSSSPDATFSITPFELKILKEYSIYKSKKKIKSSFNSEKNSQIFRRSIYAIRDINKGEIFTENNIQSFRPNIGVCASNYFKLLKKKSKFKIKKFNPIKI